MHKTTIKHHGTILDIMRTAVVTGAILTSTFFKEIFTKLQIEQFYLAGPILVAIVGMPAISFLVNTVIERWSWFRKWLAGRDDIEGEWVNIVVNTSKPTEIWAAEYCAIKYSDGEYVISGDTWSLNGTHLGSFWSAASRLESRKFEYYYKAQPSEGAESTGYGRVIFRPKDTTPSEFHCRYLDELTKVPHVTIGRKVASARTDMKDEADVMPIRKAAALDYARSFGEIPPIRGFASA